MYWTLWHLPYRRALSHAQACVSFINKAITHDFHIVKCYTAGSDIAASFIIVFCRLFSLFPKSFTAFKLLQDILLQISKLNGLCRPDLPLFAYAAKVIMIPGKSNSSNSVLSSPTHLCFLLVWHCNNQKNQDWPCVLAVLAWIGRTARMSEVSRWSALTQSVCTSSTSELNHSKIIHRHDRQNEDFPAQALQDSLCIATMIAVQYDLLIRWWISAWQHWSAWQYQSDMKSSHLFHLMCLWKFHAHSSCRLVRLVRRPNFHKQFSKVVSVLGSDPCWSACWSGCIWSTMLTCKSLSWGRLSRDPSIRSTDCKAVISSFY